MIQIHPALTPLAVGSIINRIQAYSITIPTGATSATATITAVNTSNSKLYRDGFSVSGNVTPNKFAVRVEQTDATTITAYRNTSDASETVTVSGFVNDYISGVITNNQRGTISLSSGNTAVSQAITSSSTTLTEGTSLGQTTDYSTNNAAGPWWAAVQQDSATSISGNRNSSTGNTVLGYEVTTYSSTYMQYASLLGKNVAANSQYDFQAFTAAIANTQDIMITSGGQNSQASIADYQHDFICPGFFNSLGVLMERNASNATGTNGLRMNVLCWRPGILKRRFLNNLGSIANSASTGSLALPSGVLTAAKTMSVYLGQRTSSYTKTTASPADVFCRGRYDGANGIAYARGGTSGANTIGVGVYEFV